MASARTRDLEVTGRTLRLISVATTAGGKPPVDERTIAKFLRGERIRNDELRVRIARACAVAGLEPARPRTTEAVVAQELVRA